MALAALHPPVTGTRAPARVTPEVFFPKSIDNSRVVRVSDRKRTREMALFSAATFFLLALVMVYAWQHFSAVQYGYRIEQLRAQRDALGEMNRALRLEEASLLDPERIDALAQQMGLGAPEAGQFVRLDPTLDPGMPVLAQVSLQGMASR